MRQYHLVIPTLLAGLLAACGGGGSSAPAQAPAPVAVVPPSPATPSAPVIVAPEAPYSALLATQSTIVNAPVENTLHSSGFINAYAGPRTYGYGDFDRDGCTDMVIAPTYFNHQVELPLEIYRGDCKGAFTKASDTMIAGSIPTTGSVNHIFVRDFNGDGRDDILIIDQGLEDKDAMTPGFDGARNKLLLSDAAGKLTLQPASFMDDNDARFNHLSAVADIDGDGAPDLVLVRLGGPRFGNGGVQVFLNDTHGHFSDKTADLLPAEVTAAGGDSFGAGGAAVADLDHDGKLEIVLASYANGKSAVLQRDAAGKFRIAQQYDLPQQYAGIGYMSASKAADNGRGLGGSSIAVGDFNGDGNQDLAILWEGSNKSYVQILNGNGGMGFTDATAMLDGLTVDHAFSGNNVPVSRLSAFDANGDGVPELVAESYGFSINDLATRSPYLVYDKASNRMSFMRILGAMDPAQFAAFSGIGADEQMGLRVVDLNRDGKLDFLAVKAMDATRMSATLSYFASARFYGAISK